MDDEIDYDNIVQISSSWKEILAARATAILGI